MLNQWSLALEDCTKALSLDEEFTKAQLRAAKCHLMLGNPSLSIDYYSKVLDVERANKQARAELELSRSVQQNLEKAERQVAKGDYRTVSGVVGH